MGMVTNMQGRNFILTKRMKLRRLTVEITMSLSSSCPLFVTL